jgi:citrate lyase alpha subunit
LLLHTLSFPNDPSLLVSSLISSSKSFLDHAATLGVVSGILKVGASSASAYSICGGLQKERQIRINGEKVCVFRSGCFKKTTKIGY